MGQYFTVSLLDLDVPGPGCTCPASATSCISGLSRSQKGLGNLTQRSQGRSGGDPPEILGNPGLWPVHTPGAWPSSFSVCKVEAPDWSAQATHGAHALGPTFPRKLFWQRALLPGPATMASGPCGPAQSRGVDVQARGCPTWPPHGSLVKSPCVPAQFPPPPRARELLSCFILGRKSEVVLFFPLLPAQAVGTVP